MEITQQTLGITLIISFVYSFIAIICIYRTLKDRNYEIEWGGAHMMSMFIQYSDLNKNDKQKINWLKHQIWSFILMFGSTIAIMIMH